LFDAVLFDCDGVLINSMPYHVKAWQTVLKSFDIEVNPEWVLLGEGRKAEEMATEILARFELHFSEDELCKLVDQKQDTYRKILQATPEPGINALMAQIKTNGLATAIVTGSSRKNPVHGLGSDIVSQFDILLGGEDVTAGKPSPECYLKAAGLLHIHPEKCLVVENAPLGIQAAKQADMTVIALRTTLHESHLGNADFIYKNLQDLSSNWELFFAVVSAQVQATT